MQFAFNLPGVFEGAGKTLSLKFAQCGYTVFACLPPHPESAGGSSRQSASSVGPFTLCIYHLRFSTEFGVTMNTQLLFEWQREKAQARETFLGSIVPLVVDPAVAEERIKAVETTRAYCATQTLTLCAVISPPHSLSDRVDVEDVDERTLLDEDYHFPLALTDPNVFAWAMEKHLTHPLMMIQHFLSVLRKSSGRIIFFSASTRSGLGCA